MCSLNPGDCLTNVSRALQNNLAKLYNAGNHICVENFKLKLCTCAQSYALGTRTKFQLEILIRSTVPAIHKFWENILESSRNVNQTIPGHRGWVLTDNTRTTTKTRSTRRTHLSLLTSWSAWSWKNIRVTPQVCSTWSLKSLTMPRTGQQLRKHQSSTWLILCGRNPLDFPHKEPVIRKTFPCHDFVIHRGQGSA